MAKPSFLGSVISGVTGAVKGAIGLGVLAAAAGALIGTGLGAFAAVGIAGGMVGGAIGGTIIGGMIGAALGAPLGTITGIVKSREGDSPEAQDIVNLAKISFAQGVVAGRDKNVSQEAVEQVRNSVNHKDTEDARRAFAAAQKQLGAQV